MEELCNCVINVIGGVFNACGHFCNATELVGSDNGITTPVGRPDDRSVQKPVQKPVQSLHMNRLLSV